MKHALASVALMGLVVMGCDNDASSEKPGDPTTAGGTTRGPEVDADSASASVTSSTGTAFPAGSTGSDGAGTVTSTGAGGQGNIDGSGGAAGGGGEVAIDCENGMGGEAGLDDLPEDPFPAIAMTRAQRQAWLDQQNTAGVSTTGSVEEDSDDLWVVITDTALVCNELAPWPPCGGHWRVDMMLTRAMQEVGVHDLAGEWFGTAYSGEAEDPNFPDICGGGGGGGISCGSIEVLEINDSEIRFRLDADPWPVGDDIKGIYTVPRCVE